MILVKCERCGATAPLDEAQDTWAAVDVTPLHGMVGRWYRDDRNEVCPGCLTEAERGRLEQAHLCQEERPF